MERFTIKAIDRSSIELADYNPRRISDSAKKKLRAGMTDLGLLAPLIWNEKTGRLVSGHQRLSILDEENRYPHHNLDYSITVSAVWLDEAEERAANVLLNNQAAMGEWDLGGLSELLQFEGLDLGLTGFDAEDLDGIFEGYGDTEQSPSSGPADALPPSQPKQPGCELVIHFESEGRRSEFCEMFGLPDQPRLSGESVEIDLLNRLAALAEEQ